MKDYGLYQFYTTASSTTGGSYYRDDHNNDHVELDDRAPLPLLIGIGLALFIGFVILVLICCLCRRRRGANPPTDHSGMAANYQRAPMNDGMGLAGVAYPMTAVPPVSYPNSSVPYPPPIIGHNVQHSYGGGMNYSSAVNQYPQQPPHFGGVPTFPPNQYIPTLPLAPHSVPHKPHSVSHSSQGSSASAATADPLVPPASSASVQQQQHHPPPHQQHHPPPHQQQFQQFQHHPNMPPPSALQHHPHMQQQFVSGRQSPALHYPQMSYSAMLANDVHANQASAAPVMNTMVTMGTTTVTSSMTSLPLNRPMTNHQPPVMTQSLSYTDEDVDEEEK